MELFEFNSKIKSILIAGFLLKIICIFVLNSSFTTYDSFYTPQYAIEKVRYWQGQSDFSFNVNQFGRGEGYFHFVALIMLFFGENVAIVSLFNVFLFSLSVILILYIVKNIFDDKTALISAILFMVMPSLTLWTNLVLKEALVIFLTSLGFFSIYNFRKKRSVIYLGLFISVPILLIYLRFYISIIFILIFIYFLLFDSSKIEKKYKLIAFLVCSLVLFYMSTFDDTNLFNFSLNYLNKTRMSMSYGGTAFYPEADLSNITALIKFFPVGVSYFLFSPFPWDILTIKEALYFVDNVVWYLLLPFIFRGLFISRKKLNYLWPILFYVFVLLVLYSLIEGNVGTLLRHRVQFSFFMLLFASTGIRSFLSK